MSTNPSDFLYKNHKFHATKISVADFSGSAGKEYAPDYDEVRLHFLNDLSDGDGDRNVYVEWVSINGKVHHASDGWQQSKCVPANPFNAGYLYCGGYLSIPADTSASGPVRRHAENTLQLDSSGLSASQVFLDRAHHPDNGKQKHPSIAFSLVDVALGMVGKTDQIDNRLPIRMVTGQAVDKHYPGCIFFTA